MIEIYAINASALSQFMSQYVRKEHARADRSFYFASKHCRVKKKEKKILLRSKNFLAMYVHTCIVWKKWERGAKERYEIPGGSSQKLYLRLGSKYSAGRVCA